MNRDEWQMALPANRSMRADAIIPLSAPAKSLTAFLSLGLVSTGPLGIWISGSLASPNQGTDALFASRSDSTP
jgi:hypothetical protein